MSETEGTTEELVEVEFFERSEFSEEDLIKITRETLTRIGTPSPDNSNELTQTSYLIQLDHRYYVCHYKEIFNLSGQGAEIKPVDLAIRNATIEKLSEWRLLKPTEESEELIEKTNPKMPGSSSLLPMRVLSTKEKRNWKLVPKVYYGSF